MTFSVKYVWQWLLDNFRCTNIATNANQVSMHAALSSKTKCNMFLRIESLVHFKETMHNIALFWEKNKIQIIHRKCIEIDSMCHFRLLLVVCGVGYYFTNILHYLGDYSPSVCPSKPMCYNTCIQRYVWLVTQSVKSTLYPGSILKIKTIIVVKQNL